MELACLDSYMLFLYYIYVNTKHVAICTLNVFEEREREELDR